MRIRAMTYNIHKGFDTWGFKFVLNEIKTGVQNVGADLVFLQEVVGQHNKWKEKIKDYPTQPQFEFLAEDIWPHYSYGKNAVFTHSDHGNAILSKFPIVFSENINISNHSLEQRGLLHADVQIPDTPGLLHLFNVHLDLLHRGREKQLARLLERFTSHIPLDGAFILAGDFNDWPQKVTDFLNQKLMLTECHKKIHGDYGRSFPSQFPLLKLDRMYSHNLKVIHAEVLNSEPWSFLSDHLPMVVEFEI